MERRRIAIVGTGFSGIGMAIALRREGVEDFVLLERAGDLGGTWRDNSYPGCQCDVPSHLYSFSFAPNPDWSRTFSPQSEIWDYLRRCAEEHGVVPHVRFDHEVLSADWDENAAAWRIETPHGALLADVLVSGVGGLSDPKVPDVPGLSRFEGTVFHSAAWDHEHDLRGERVAVIGTGASAIQFVPKIQPLVERLYVLQRTPPWVVPHSDRPISSFERHVYRAFPPAQRAVRAAIYGLRELLVLGFAFDRRFMKLPERVARRHLRRQVPDPELRRRLSPSYTIGCKRILPSNDWYPALTRPNVEVVDAGLREVRSHSVVAADGSEHEVDTIAFGTGFHVTDMPIGSVIRGRAGTTLDEQWRGSPEAYMGTTIAGFPNLFMLMGPNTGLGHTSVVYMIESQIRHVMQALRAMDRHGLQTLEVRPEVQRRFNHELQAQLRRSVWNSGGCASYYIDSNGRNSTLWPSFTWRFRQQAGSFSLAEYATS